MVGLGSALSVIHIVKMPLGGSITPLSMLPLVLISICFGIKWGLVSSFAYSVIQLVFGLSVDGLLGWGLSGPQLAGCIVLDYFAAYTALGLAGIFGRKKPLAPVYGTALAMLLRFSIHILSGVIIFSHLGQKFELFNKLILGKPLLYSVCYNGFFMLPETIFTCVAVYILIKIRFFEKTSL